MHTPMIDLRAQYASIKQEIDEAVMQVLTTQQFRGGPVVEGFERDLAAFAGAAHAAGVGSGTDALFLALKAVGLQPGDEVIATPFSFFATAGAIVNAGGAPVFADIRPDSYNIDPDAVAALITPRTRVILPVHLYGQCADMTAIKALADQHGIVIIEDAAQALGARHKDQPVGAWGAAAALSFYPTKNLGGAGEGGATLRLLRCHGASELYKHVVVGVNSHLHALQAAVLQVKLRKLTVWNDARRARAAYYSEQLASLDGIVVPTESPDNFHVFHQYVIRIRERDLAKQRLAAQGIASGIFYPLPLHRQPCFAPYCRPDVSCPEAERASREVLALPLYPELTQQQQDGVVTALKEHLNARQSS